MPQSSKDDGRALRDQKRAEESLDSLKTASVIPLKITTELKEAFCQLGAKLPNIWDTGVLSRENKKALLRCLIDKVIIHRARRDLVQTRIVWRGGATSSFDVPIAAGSLTELSFSDQMEKQIVQLSQAGKRDDVIAKELTKKGFRSPLSDHLLPSTVRAIRLRHGIIRKQSQSHPRRITGFLTVPQIAKTLDIPRHWIYDRINKGVIHVTKDSPTGLYLIPDNPKTIEQFQKLIAGTIQTLGC